MAKTGKRGSGKFLTGLIAFLLGFIIAVIVETGVILGGGYYIINYVKIDTLFSIAGQPNRDDGDKPIYINTDSYATIISLINEITDLASGGWEDLPVGTLIEMSPILEERLGDLCDMVAEDYGVYIDMADLKQQTGGSLQTYFMDDVIREIRPYEVVTKVAAKNGSDIAGNPYVVTILDGREAYTVQADGERCVVYYDEYIEGADGNYYRVTDNKGSDQALPAYLAQDAETWLVRTNSVWKDELETAVPVADGSFVYRQYYYHNPSTGEYTATTLNEEDDAEGNTIYSFDYYDHDAAPYPAQYGSDVQRYTGNYLINAAGEREYLTYADTDADGNAVTGSLEITVGYIMDRNFDINTLYYVGLPEVLADVMGQDPILDMLFEGITLGEMYSRGIEFSEQVDQFALADVLKPTAEEDDILLYLCYKIRNVDRQTLTASYTYIGEDGTEEERTANIILGSDGVIDKVVDAETGEELEKTRVRDINQLIGDLDITILTGPVAIEDNNLMAYIVYGISDIRANGDGTYSAVYSAGGENEACTVYVNESGNIASVVRDSDGSPVRPATKDDIDDRLNGITDALTLADFVSVTPSHTGADGRAVNNNIMLFTVYSATMQPGEAMTDENGVYYSGTYHDENGDSYSARIYVKDGSLPVSEQSVSHVVYSVDGGLTYTADGALTSISEVEGQINRLADVLTIGDIISIDPEDRLMSKLGSYTINNISAAMDEIVVSDAVDVDPADDIIMYVAFGVTDVYEQNGRWYGTYHGLDGQSTVQAEILTDTVTVSGAEQIIAVGIAGADGAPVTEGGEVFNGTPVSQVGARVQNITEDISAIAFIGDVSVQSPVMMYIGYGVTSVSVNEDGVYTGIYTDENGYSYPCTIEVDGEGNVSSVYYVDAGGRVEVDGVKIADLQGRVDGITSALTIGEIIGEDNISADDKLLNMIKDSTVDGLSDTFDSLSVQNLFSEEIYDHYYRVVESDPSSGEVIYNPNYTYYTLGADGTYVYVGSVAQGQMDPDTVYYVRFGSEWLLAVDTVTGTDQIVFNPEYVYYTRTDNGDGTYSYELVGGDGRLSALDGSTEYYTRGRATGVWYLLLYDVVDSGSAEVVYTVNELGNMMTEAADNLTNSTLWDFYEAGVIEEPSHNRVPILAATEATPGAEEFTMNVNVQGTPVQISFGYYVFKEVADCTIDEIMNAVTILTNLIN